MYIWVLLATFMAILYSYNLSPRADIRELEIEPVAKALISKLVIKQQAAGRYMRGNTPPFASSTDAEGNVTKSENITYTSGILTQAELNPSEGVTFLPYGFKDDGSVKTEIYCLRKDNQAVAMDCSDDDAIRYLVAYTVIPQRWLNVKTGLPNNDFNNAMKQIIGYDSSFGYPSCKEYEEDPITSMKVCKKFVIRGREGLTHTGLGDDGVTVVENVINMEIPEYVAKHGGFASDCGTNSNHLCLIYIYEYQFKYVS